VDTVITIAVFGFAGLAMATSIVVRGRRRGESALKSLDDNIVAFPGFLLLAGAGFFRHSLVARVLTISGLVLIALRLLWRGRRSTPH
jgi:hypothetical protein